jgi:SpoVK/Ycf46/Vps4 family AAA+-type ATPase
VVVLASNLLQNIDEAFMRRIQTVIEFPRPGPRARQRIWAGMFPPQVGRPDDEELKLLAARFQLAGGSIKNVVLDAAFRALARDQDQPVTVTTRDLVISTAREYQKLGLPITKGEFGEDWYGWVEELLSDGHEVAQPLPKGA